MEGPGNPIVVGAVLWIAIGLTSLRGDVRSREANEEPVPGPVTFTRDVAPIVFQSCVPCHRSGGSAPFSLAGYQEVRQRARLIATVTRSRFMPPWLPEPHFGEFVGARRLTDDQIETIGRWVDQGAVEGSGVDLPPLPRFTEGWQLGEPDLMIKLPQPYTLPAEGKDVWRNFIIPIPVSATHYVNAVELRQGSNRFVHHAVMAVDRTRSSRRRDEQDAEVGFEGMDMGHAQVPDGHLLVWTPGRLPSLSNAGMAWRLDPGTDLVLQLHMLPSGKPEVIDPIVGLHFEETAPTGRPTYLIKLSADHAIDIPAGAKDFVVSDAFELPVEVDLLMVYPHAHYLAKTVEGLATLPTGAERWLLRIKEWNFNWQDAYRYASPISLAKGTTVRLRYSYDNSADNVRNPNHPPRRVVNGDRSSDEMAHLWLQVQTRTAGDLAILKEAFYRHALARNPRRSSNYFNLGTVLWDRGRLAEAARYYRAGLNIEPGHAAMRANLGAVLLQQGHVDEAIGQFREALRSEPDFANAHYNLGNVMRSQGRLDDAIAQYREAVRLEPYFASAHNNLGAALASQAKIEEAIGHFQRAVEIEPENASARRNLKLALEKAASSGRIKP